MWMNHFCWEVHKVLRKGLWADNAFVSRKWIETEIPAMHDGIEDKQDKRTKLDMDHLYKCHKCFQIHPNLLVLHSIALIYYYINDYFCPVSPTSLVLNCSSIIFFFCFQIPDLWLRQRQKASVQETNNPSHGLDGFKTRTTKKILNFK